MTADPDRGRKVVDMNLLKWFGYAVWTVFLLAFLNFAWQNFLAQEYRALIVTVFFTSILFAGGVGIRLVLTKVIRTRSIEQTASRNVEQ